MTKKKVLIILIAAIVLIAVGVGIALNFMLDPYEKQIRLGYKLLEQGDYEQAILAFDKAIEIDVKRDTAYIGKADVYVARCDDDTLEDLKDVFEEAYSQHYNDENVINAIIRISDELADKGKQEWADELLDFGYELTKDKRIKNHKKQIFNFFADDILVDLYKMFEQGDEEAVKKEIQSEKYLNFVNKIDTTDYQHIYFPKKAKSKTGKGVALYYVESAKYGNIFVYYGDFEKGKRSGEGTWVGAHDKAFYWFTGEWENDKPNGYGDVKEWKESLHSGMTVRNLKGELVDGVWNGDMNWNFVYPDETDEHVLRFENGYATPTDTSENDGKTTYCISSPNNPNSGLWFSIDPSTTKIGIIGFDDFGTIS